MRNPFGETYRNLGEMSIGALIAGIGARAIPEKVDALSGMNSGFSGYALNLLSGGVIAWLLGKTPLGRNGAVGGAIGAVVMTGGRIVSDQWGKTVVTFSLPQSNQPSAAAVPLSGMGRFGDPAFNLGKYVKPYNFPLPTSGKPMVPALPAAAAKATAGRPLSRYRSVM